MKKLLILGASVLIFAMTGCVRTSIPTGYVETQEPAELVSEKELKDKVSEIEEALEEMKSHLGELTVIERNTTWVFNGDKINLSQAEAYPALSAAVKKTADDYEKLAKAPNYPSLDALYSLGKDYMTLCRDTFTSFDAEIEKTAYAEAKEKCILDEDAIETAKYTLWIDYYTTKGDLSNANKKRNEFNGWVKHNHEDLELPLHHKASEFTNAYGTPVTVCAQTGCGQYIAESGDTNCCEAHSSQCKKCGCYIDADHIYCQECAAKLHLKTFDETLKADKREKKEEEKK